MGIIEPMELWKDRHIGHNKVIDSFGNEWEVSTINLKDSHAKNPLCKLLDVSFGVSEPYETMVFQLQNSKRISGQDYYLQRYRDEEDAKLGHIKICEEILSGQIKPKPRNPIENGW